MLRIAILDLYEGQPNQGMRCIRELLSSYALPEGIEMHKREFDVRLKEELPDLSHDIYISSGGPGSPLESEGSSWEKKYFEWLQKVEDHNRSVNQNKKKFVLFICHSFQLACRHYAIASVTKRKSTALLSAQIKQSGYIRIKKRSLGPDLLAREVLFEIVVPGWVRLNIRRV